jgi:capsular polysaccharide biosynthesis protein
MQNERDIIEIDLLEMLLYMRSRWYWFVASTVAAVLIGMFICLFFITPQYKSTSKIIILSQSNTGAMTYSDIQLAERLTKDFEELIKSRSVLESVIAECGLDEGYGSLLGRVSVENVSDTRIISITVEDPSANNAQTIADAIRETAAQHIKNVTDVEAVNIVETANLPSAPSSPSKTMWAVLSALLGFGLVLVIELIHFLSDDTIKSAEDAEKYLGLTTLGVIPKMEEDAKVKAKVKGVANGRRKKLA